MYVYVRVKLYIYIHTLYKVSVCMNMRNAKISKHN